MPGLQEGVVDSVANSNFKNQAEMPMQYGNLILNDAVIAGRNMTAIREKSVARSLERFDVVNSDENENVLASLGTVVAALQQIMKGAQSTRPETGG